MPIVIRELERYSKVIVVLPLFLDCCLNVADIEPSFNRLLPPSRQ